MLRCRSFYKYVFVFEQAKKRKGGDDGAATAEKKSRSVTPTPPLPTKAERKVAKAKRKADKRALGRDNDYVITTVSEARRNEIWKTVTEAKSIVSRADEKMPMSDCWTYGARKDYSYFPLGHGNSQLKLTQLAVWIKECKVKLVALLFFHDAYSLLCLG